MNLRNVSDKLAISPVPSSTRKNHMLSKNMHTPSSQITFLLHFGQQTVVKFRWERQCGCVTIVERRTSLHKLHIIKRGQQMFSQCHQNDVCFVWRSRGCLFYFLVLIGDDNSTFHLHTFASSSSSSMCKVDR